MDRMEKTAKVLSKVLAVIRIILIVVCALAFLAALALIIWANTIMNAVGQSSGASTSFDFGALVVVVPLTAMSASSLRILGIVTVLAVAVLLALMLIAIAILRRLLDDIGQGHPFAPESPGLVRRFAILIFVGSVVVPLVQNLTQFFIVRAIGLQNSVTPMASGVSLNVGSGFSFSIDLTAVFIGFAVLLLAYVFEYGAHLQAQADETL